LARQPVIKRPGELSAQETLGACLGFCLLDTELGGAPKTVNVKLTDEEEDLPHPQMLFLYSLNGMLRFYGVYNDLWRQSNLLSTPTPVSSAKTSSVKAESQTQIKPNLNGFVLPKL
jgi:hypothetical protein